MQTFLPYEDFEETASVLDMKRLGKQRVETWQIWQALTGSSGWKHHPAVKMWDRHRWWLLFYGITVCLEWRKRKYNDTLLERFVASIEIIDQDEYPSWLGDPKLHSSHRANLLRKDEKHYGKFGWTELPETGYYWPSKV